MPPRVKASLYASERADSWLQCSVASIWIARGSSIDVIGLGSLAVGGGEAMARA